ncbi:MAG TPA: GlmU family protein [Flavobacteriales bacterium]|nr:GlmU family protein [Flavobacteriales bacterium]HNK68185.1 GlmU family protein [Flavobacteriales bacterium]HNM68370.1 GlmU family protein [Flavobacteriales bacterium]HNO05804.1 GlmU family protein [Flavobacteriales bacterium]
MAIILSDAGRWKHLLPLTFTRPVGALRPGIFTMAEAWGSLAQQATGYNTEAYLATKFPAASADIVREVDATLLPLPELVEAVLELRPGEALTHRGRSLAFCRAGFEPLEPGAWEKLSTTWRAKGYPGEVISYERPWYLFQYCGRAILNDFAYLTSHRTSAPLHASNTVIGDPSLVFLEAGAVAHAATFNTTNGPVWIGAGAEVMEGALLRGPIALGQHAQIKMGAKIYGPSAFGPACRVGGEVNNSVMLGYSNKGHDGFLGNSVLGEWCNLGADTNNSNLKNTYGRVKVWSYAEENMVNTGLQFCGLIMGDHSRSGINTMFNTGTVVGVSANIFGADFPPKRIPSFAWGGASGFDLYDLERAMETAHQVMERRGVALTPVDEEILKVVFHRDNAEES